MKLLKKDTLLVKLLGKTDEGFVANGIGEVISISEGVDGIDVGDTVTFNLAAYTYKPNSENLQVFVNVNTVLLVEKEESEKVDECPYFVRYRNQLLCEVVEKGNASNSYFTTVKVVKFGEDCVRIAVGDLLLVKDRITLPNNKHCLVYNKDIWLFTK